MSLVIVASCRSSLGFVPVALPGRLPGLLWMIQLLFSRGCRTFRAFDTSKQGVLDVSELIEGFRRPGRMGWMDSVAVRSLKCLK